MVESFNTRTDPLRPTCTSCARLLSAPRKGTDVKGEAHQSFKNSRSPVAVKPGEAACILLAKALGPPYEAAE
jgi:hypothetical protein